MGRQNNNAHSSKCYCMDQNWFRPKSLKVRNAVQRCMHVFVKCPPPETFWLVGSQMVHSSGILSHRTPIPLPSPLKNIFSSYLH